jgi:hypothetical protein
MSLRNTGRPSLVGIDTASSERNLRTTASSSSDNGAQSNKIRDTGALVVETAEEAEGVEEGISLVLGTG